MRFSVTRVQHVQFRFRQLHSFIPVQIDSFFIYVSLISNRQIKHRSDNDVDAPCGLRLYQYDLSVSDTKAQIIVQAIHQNDVDRDILQFLKALW